MGRQLAATVEEINDPPYTHLVWYPGEEHRWANIRMVNKLNRKAVRLKLKWDMQAPAYDKERGIWYLKCYK